MLPSNSGARRPKRSASSPDSSARATLEVQTADPATELYVIDGQFNLVDRGWGSQSFTLDPGIYKLKARAGYATQEEHVILAPGARERYTIPLLAFASAMPLSSTATTHEYQVDAAMQESKKVHVRAGQGSWLFVMARNWTLGASSPESAAPPVPPARGLTLHTPDGSLVADLAVAGVGYLPAVGAVERDAWSTCSLALAPGPYCLRLETPYGPPLEQMIYAAPGWQTQFFCLLQNCAPPGQSEDRWADILNAAVQMVRAAGDTPSGFVPDEPVARLVELARQGLANDRLVLADPIIDELLTGKFDNPLLGIFGAHLMLLTKKQTMRDERPPQSAQMQEVIKNLRLLVGDAHPDVEALAAHLEPQGTLYRFKVPPMLRKSWELVVQRSIEQPDIVPRDSLAYRISDRIWGEGPWLVWMAPDVSIAASGASAEEDLLRQTIRAYLQPKPAYVAGQEPVLESAMAFAAPEADTPPFFQADSAAVPEDEVGTLVLATGLPRTKIESLVQELSG